jgi:hypothetical protein
MHPKILNIKKAMSLLQVYLKARIYVCPNRLSKEADTLKQNGISFMPQSISNNKIIVLWAMAI